MFSLFCSLLVTIDWLTKLLVEVSVGRGDWLTWLLVEGGGSLGGFPVVIVLDNVGGGGGGRVLYSMAVSSCIMGDCLTALLIEVGGGFLGGGAAVFD